MVLLAVAFMVLCASVCVCYAIWTHHRQEMRRLYLREQEIQGMYLLNDKALEHGLAANREQFTRELRER